MYRKVKESKDSVLFSFFVKSPDRLIDQVVKFSFQLRGTEEHTRSQAENRIVTSIYYVHVFALSFFLFLFLILFCWLQQRICLQLS